ncbi:MAG: hypothetical protein DRP85_06970 [Candidatus Makaraimicrobium thalassicum]|nr:MAG: hypothetical protein DRP85_06970 [Candidatus Omnitrophota bacterium]
MKKTIIIFAMILSLILALTSAHSYYGPRALLTENITGTYTTTDGASSGTPASFSSTGYITVYVPNTDDVLQYVRLNLTNAIARTNIENWNGTETVYRDYAQSYPTLASGTNMYMNLTTGNKRECYTPDFTWAPSLNISMSVTNARAGDDLYSEKDIINPINLLHFNFTIINPAGNKNISGTNITYKITFNPENTGASDNNASVSIIESTVESTGGATWTTSADGSADLDQIEWQGTLDAGAQVDITFDATVWGGHNYGSGGQTENNLNHGTYGANALYQNNTHVISEITFNGHFARGPIREGVDLMKGTPWRVKSYINNIAETSPTTGEALTYLISSWRIYNVTAATGQIESLLDSNDALYQDLAADSQFKIPNWIETTSIKPYIAPYFNWSVHWNDTNVYTYSGKINFSMILPTLYEIDTLATKETADSFAPEVYNTKLLTYNATAYHTGDSDNQIRAGKLQIYSVIPNGDTTSSGYANMTVTNYHVYYTNDTSTYELTVDGSNVQVTTSNTTSSANGTIILDISDLSSATLSASGTVGQNLTNGDYISLVYDIWTYENSTGSLTSGIDNNEYFHFDGNQTLYTQSGTYIVYNSSDLKQASQNSLNAYKQLISTDPADPQLVNVTIYLATTGEIDSIKLIDYIPTGMSNHTPVSMTSNIGSTTFNRTKLGTITTSDGVSMDAWEITHPTVNAGWDMTDGQYIQFTYQLNLSTPGLYILPVQIAAFDPGVGNGITLTRYGMIKYVVPEKTVPLVIDEDDTLQLFKTVILGKPGVWRKSFNVYNPNSKPTTSQFRTEVFKDAVESYANYYDAYGKNIEESVDTDVVDNRKYIFWESTLKPYESRTYELRVLTPPAVEVDRDMEVLEKLENKHVKLKADIVIKNFAEEPYTNLKMNLNIPKDNIFELKDAFGKDISYTGDASTTTVTIPRLGANTVLSLSVTYKQSYPTVIITPDRTRYDSGDIANLEILIINGGEKIENPSLETEIYTEDMDLVYADIIRLEKSLKPLEKTELSAKFLLPVNAPTGKYIANIRFSEDMTTITDSTINFYVLGMKGDSSGSAKILIIVLIGAVLIYFAYKRLVRVTKK